jgi:CO dehydrogenase/acetyl-CoA synthase alpha subunit
MSRPASNRRKGHVEALPDLTKLGDDDLDTLIEDLERRESEVSYERRLLQGKIDILRAERVARKRGKPEEELAQVDVERLSEILARKASPEAE